jgi:hypothetical protein
VLIVRKVLTYLQLKVSTQIVERRTDSDPKAARVLSLNYSL